MSQWVVLGFGLGFLLGSFYGTIMAHRVHAKRDRQR